MTCIRLIGFSSPPKLRGGVRGLVWHVALVKGEKLEKRFQTTIHEGARAQEFDAETYFLSRSDTASPPDNVGILCMLRYHSGICNARNDSVHKCCGYRIACTAAFRLRRHDTARGLTYLRTRNVFNNPSKWTIDSTCLASSKIC